jgi:hypothetical protein
MCGVSNLVGINVPGLVGTFLAIGPRYAVFAALATLVQEFLRVLSWISLGGEVTEIWIGGFFSHARGAGGPAPALLLAGPLLSLVSALLFVGASRPPVKRLLNPLARYDRPFGAVLLKLAVGSIVFTFLDTVFR